MNSQLLQALMMGMGGGTGTGTGLPMAGGLGMPADSSGSESMFGGGGMSPQLLQFASGALTGGGFQGGVGKLMGGLLAQKMKQRLMQQQQPQPQGGNPLDALFSGGDPGFGGQPTA